jgi:hypothetical protein
MFRFVISAIIVFICYSQNITYEPSSEPTLQPSFPQTEAPTNYKYFCLQCQSVTCSMVPPANSDSPCYQGTKAYANRFYNSVSNSILIARLVQLF